MSKKQVGYLGGKARIKKYGNPGTLEGRRKGGHNSVASNLKLKNNFKIAKEHLKPINSFLLAEFLGIMIGDGHLSKYQLSVTTNSETDIEHAFYIKDLFKKLFNIECNLRLKKKVKAVEIVASSVNLVKWINQKGMPVGNKLVDGLSIPSWIYKNKLWQESFIKGLFDTDGCVYIDTHVIKNKIYTNQGWAITSYSSKLRDDIFNVLKNLGYSPTLRKTQKSVYMRKKLDIERYFQDIGTSNSKHLHRYNNGRVPKRS